MEATEPIITAICKNTINAVNFTFEPNTTYIFRLRGGTYQHVYNVTENGESYVSFPKDFFNKNFEELITFKSSRNCTISTEEKPTESKENYDFINPNHYKNYSVEVINMMVAIYGKEKVANYCELNAFKYRMRAGTKPEQPIERDLEKEKWYLAKANELRLL